VFLNNCCVPSPGDKTLLVAGFLAGKGLLSPWAVMAVGTSASFLGCSAAYGLGITFGRSLLQKIKWLRLTPERFARLELFFGKHGAKAVFYARLVALLHPVTGFVAGSLKTPWWPFLFFNLLGTLAYVTCYSLSGRFLWQTWELHKNDPLYLAAYLVLILGGYLLLAWYLRRALRSFFAGTETVS
jgi:membrane protein DedA with SNARE-associated domain